MDDEKDPLPTWPDYLWKFPEDKPDDWHYFPICLARVKPRGKWLLLLGVIFSECGSRGYIEHSNKKLMESIGEDDEKVIVRILRAASKRRWLVIRGKGADRKIYFNYNMITKEMIDEDERMWKEHQAREEEFMKSLEKNSTK